MTKASLSKLFIQGKFSELLNNSVDLDALDVAPADVAIVLGALVFAGRGDEALAFFERRSNEFNDEQRAESRFYLVIQLVRSGRTKAAEKLIAEAATVKDGSGRMKFFRFQSVAFFNYYLGKRKLAKDAAKLALEAAVEARALWGRVLALDILSHLNFQEGAIQQSLKSFAHCHEIALKIGNENAAAALAINIQLYRAQIAVPSASVLKELERTLFETRVEDSYSRANILLELARQATLIGQWRKAELFLNQALTFIYQFGNAKQEILLNFRWSYLAFCQGEYEKALNLISISKSKADLVREEALTLAVNGLELDILEKMNFNGDFLKVRRVHVGQLQFSHESHVNSHIRARRGLGSRTSRRGEDPFADWLDEFSVATNKYDFVLGSGAWGLLKANDLVSKSGSTMVIDVMSKKVLFSDSVSIEVVEFGSRRRLFEILTAFADGFKERRQLFEMIWQTRYVPRLHDSVIYANLTKLRKVLGRFSAFLQTGEKGYTFDPNVRIQLVGESVRKTALARPSARQMDKQINPQIVRQIKMNERQGQLLKTMSATDLIDTRTYSKLFQISTATANRDLRELFRLGRLMRSGRSRDVAYYITVPG